MKSTPNADVREGGHWSVQQRFKNDVLWWLAVGTIETFGRLPRRALEAVGAMLGSCAHLALREARETALRNVALALPELGGSERRALVARTFRTLGRALGETVSFLHAPAIPPLAFANGARAALHAAVERGRGVVLASAHLGPWERVAATLHAENIGFSAVARDPYDPRFLRIYERLRGGTTIYRGQRGSAMRLVRTLRRGGVLGIPMDLASRVPSIRVAFFGHPADTPVGPARLALRTRAEVIVGVPTRNPSNGEYQLAIDPIATDDLDTSAMSEWLLSTRINELLSARIRAVPDAWPWMHKRWGVQSTTM
jgi:KDO2-lipid IV(A) lauroyltransferase